MAKVFTEECLKEIDSKFELILLAVHRTKEILNRGDITVLQGQFGAHSAEVIALKEIAESKLNVNSLRDNLIDFLVSEYKESHLIKFIGRQSFDTNVDPQKMFRDIFKDELQDEEQTEEALTDNMNGDNGTKNSKKDSNPMQVTTDDDSIDDQKRAREDEAVSRIMQMDLDS